MATVDPSPVSWGLTGTSYNTDYAIYNFGIACWPNDTQIAPKRDENEYQRAEWEKILRHDIVTKFHEAFEDKPVKERKPNMETLYQVIVVSKDREILLDEMVVAEDVDEAKLGVDIHSVLRDKKLKLKDVTILATELGDVKVRKEVQKVKVVDKDEE